MSRCHSGRVGACAGSAAVTRQWFAVLCLLQRADGYQLPIELLARALSMTAAQLTCLADRMARQGLIERDPHGVVTLTARGEDAARRAAGLCRAALREQQRAALLAAHPADFARLTRALTQCASVVTDFGR